MASARAGRPVHLRPQGLLEDSSCSSECQVGAEMFPVETECVVPENNDGISVSPRATYPEVEAEYCLVPNEDGVYVLVPASSIKAALSNGEDSDEIWQLPDNLCRICAKRSEHIENAFSEKSKKLGLVEMIHSHLPILVTPEDLLPVTVCRTCISSLQIAEKLVKTCLAADNILRVLVGHFRNVSLPAGPFENSSSADDAVAAACSDDYEIKHSSRTLSILAQPPVSALNQQQKKEGASNGNRNDNTKSRAHTHQLSICTRRDELPSKLVKAVDFEGTHVQFPKLANIAEKSGHTKVENKTFVTSRKRSRSVACLKVSYGTSSCDVKNVGIHSSQTEVTDLIGMETDDIRQRVDDEIDCGRNDDSLADLNPISLLESDGVGDLTSLNPNKNTSESQLNENCESRIVGIENNPDDTRVPSLCDKEEETKKKDKVLAARLKRTKRQKERRLLVRLSKPLSCCECDFIATTKEELGEHKNLHLECKYCGKQHKTRMNLIEHERIHTKEKPFVCDKCGWKFRTKPQMMQHAQRHNTETPYECKICSKRFSVKTTYTDHLQRHNKESPYLCETCGRSFKLQAALRFHKFSHRTFKCPTCDKSFSYRAYQVHKRSHSGEGYNCPECGRMFLSKEHLKKHLRIHEGTYPYKCGVCHRPFKIISHLQTHRHRHAGELLLRLKFYVCAVCDENFDEAVGLAAHVRKHSKEEIETTKVFRCSSCDKCFPTEHELHSHELEHATTPLFSCSTCDQSFSQLEELDKHASDHFEDKPHACDICGKRFGALMNLNSHKAVHQSVKPYSCKLCTKSFKTLNGLNQHKMVHSDVRKFSCQTCELTFKRRDALKNHERTHFTERPYTCSVCSHSFKVKSDCTTHLRRHRLSGLDGTVIESSYNCHKCPQTFTLKVDLSNHIHACHHHEIPEPNLNQDTSLSEDVDVSTEVAFF